MVNISTKDFINLLKNLKDGVEMNVSIEIKPLVKKVDIPEQYATDANIITQVKTFSEPLTADESLKVYAESVNEMIEKKIANAFKTQLFYVAVKSVHEPMYESKYYCSHTESRIRFRHRFQTPPPTFTIDDRGITKTYTEYYTKPIDNVAFDLNRPIILIE